MAKQATGYILIKGETIGGDVVTLWRGLDGATAYRRLRGYRAEIGHQHGDLKRVWREMETYDDEAQGDTR